MQIKNSFDKQSLKKMIRGALISFTGGGALALLGYIGTIEVSDPILIGFVAWIIPTLTNIVKEWMKGR